jgi:hypothetical protein
MHRKLADNRLSSPGWCAHQNTAPHLQRRAGFLLEGIELKGQELDEPGQFRPEISWRPLAR